MTAFSGDMIPADIDELSKLIAWSLAIAKELNPNVKAYETDGSLGKVARFSPFPIEANSTARLIARISLLLDPTYASPTTCYQSGG